MAILLDPRKDTSVEVWVHALNTIVQDPSFRGNGTLVKRVLRDTPKPAAQMAADWVEYGIRHDGAPFFRLVNQPWLVRALPLQKRERKKEGEKERRRRKLTYCSRFYYFGSCSFSLLSFLLAFFSSFRYVQYHVDLLLTLVAVIMICRWALRLACGSRKVAPKPKTN
jgi:hypothetical protein